MINTDAAKTNLIAYFNAGSDFLFRNSRTIHFPNALLRSTIYVDPNKILYKAKSPLLRVRRKKYFYAGDWDVDKRPLDEYVKNNVKYITVRELLEQGLPIEKTTEFMNILAEYSKNKSSDLQAGYSQAYKYLMSVKTMYKTIKYDGRLKTQIEMGLSPYNGEINCYLDRNEELQKATGGTHRFAIARYLRFDRVPIQVSMMHDIIYDKIINKYDNNIFDSINLYLEDIEKKYM